MSTSIPNYSAQRRGRNNPNSDPVADRLCHQPKRLKDDNINRENFMTQASEDQIKTVETIRDETLPHGERGEHAALTALLTELHEMRELLEAAVEIQFKDELFIDLGPKGWRGFIGNVRSGGISVTEHFESALDAFAEVKKQI